MRINRFALLSLLLLLSIGIVSWSDVHPTARPALAQQGNEYTALLSDFGIANRMNALGIPGMSIAVIREGKLDWASGYGILQQGASDPVDTETLFSVGSVSKVGAAVMTLKLVMDGKVELDEDVNQYLTGWKIPENEFTRDQAVTLRHIMSHTGGLSVHGFADFLPNEKLPTSVQILKGERPAKNPPVVVNIPIGSQYRYSGGGTQIEQLLIEEQAALPFHEAADKLLFEPLGMQRSTYENPVPGLLRNIAKAHNRSGKAIALPRGYQSMPEAAASGLWTTPSDFAKVMLMLMRAYEGESEYLSQAIVQDMMTPVRPSEYGLGPRIAKRGDEILFSHGGSNDSYKAHFSGSLGKRNGIVIFTNGARGSELINEIRPLFDPVLFQ